MANKKVTENKKVNRTTIKKNEIDSTTLEDPMKNTLSDKTRYTIIGVVTILFLILIIVLIAVGNSNDDKSSNGTSSSNKVEERDTSTEALKDFYKQFDSKKTNVIFFESSGCSYCQLQEPIMTQISEDYDLEYYDIDASKLTTSEIEEIVSALGISGATPTTVIVKNGKVVASNEGYLDGKPFVEFFVTNGVLEKDAIYKPEESLVEIDYSKFKDLAKKDDYQLIYLDTSACPACIEVRSILNDIAQDSDFEVNYLSAANLSSADIESLVDTDLKEMEYNDETYLEEGQIKIPLLLVIKDNKIEDYILESNEKSDYTEVLEKYGFVD